MTVDGESALSLGGSVVRYRASVRSDWLWLLV
jgi:hypothetical protein